MGESEGKELGKTEDWRIVVGGHLASSQLGRMERCYIVVEGRLASSQLDRTEPLAEWGAVSW